MSRLTKEDKLEMATNVISIIFWLSVVFLCLYLDHKHDNKIDSEYCCYCNELINEECYVVSIDGDRWHVECYKELKNYGNEEEN